VLSAARGGLVASGTATLEAALLETPMVIAYQMNFLSWKIGRARVKVPHVGLVNLVADERVVPEVLQGAVSGRSLADQLSPLLEEGDRRKEVMEGFRKVRNSLGEPGAAGRVADMAEELLNRE
jgi:lipid-A-disaccharide synthase